MAFTMESAGNPHTRGRGDALVVKHAATDIVHIMLDEYDYTPGFTLTLTEDRGICEIGETDEGCFIRFKQLEADVMFVLPISLASLRTELDIATDDRV